MMVQHACDKEKGRTDLSNEVDTDPHVLYLFYALSKVYDNFSSHRLIVQIHIKMLRRFFARNLDCAPAFAHIEHNRGFRGATEQPRLQYQIHASISMELVSNYVWPGPKQRDETVCRRTMENGLAQVPPVRPRFVTDFVATLLCTNGRCASPTPLKA